MTKSIKTTFAIVLSATLFWVSTASANNEIIKDFVAFDKAFIPPLALTNQEKVGPSQKAMKILKESWAELKEKQYYAFSGNPKWKEGFDNVEKQIIEAMEIIKGGKNLMDAHESLEEIRIITMDLRREFKIDYYIDPLTEFHIYMEEIFHTGKDNNPEDIDEKAIVSLKETLDEATALWQEIGKKNPKQNLYDFNDRMSGELKKLHNQEAKSLENLAKAISGGNKKKIKKACMGVKPNYAKLYKMFGDFKSISK